MTTDELLSRLEQVTRTSRGWKAPCPAHQDMTPSLSIREGGNGLLVYDFGGCTPKEIVQALGLKLLDLFYDAGFRNQYRKHPTFRPRMDRNRVAFQFRLHGDLVFLRSSAVINAAKECKVNTWTDEDFGRAMNAVAKAYEDRERADLFDDVALDLRRKVLAVKVNHAA